MERILSALDLFFKYANRYPAIQMKPLGFGGFTEADRFYLKPIREGEDIGHKTHLVKYPYVDVAKAGLRTRTDFKPTAGASPAIQQQAAFWKKIEADYFAKRRFSIHFRREDLPGYYRTPLPVVQMFPAHFRVWRKMRGLVLAPSRSEGHTYLHWSSFVPFGTPEHDAIQMSLDIGLAMRKHRKPSSDELAQMHEALRAKIALVPA